MKTYYAEQWYAWLEGDEGKRCADGKAEGEYLKNRLKRAFDAGWVASRHEPVNEVVPDIKQRPARRAKRRKAK